MASKRRAQGDGSIYEDKKRDRWIGEIDIAGQRRRVTAPTKAEARKRLDVLRADAGRGASGDGNITVAEAVDRWERRALAGKDLAPSTVTGYEWCCQLIRETIGTKRLRSLTPDDVELMLDHLAGARKNGRPLGRPALVKVRSVLGQVLAYAERRGQVARNVARVAEMTPTARRTAPRTALDIEDVRALVAALNGEPLGPMFLLSLTMGLRPGEAAGLHWRDVDLEAGTISLRSAVRVENGRAVIVDELKTERSRRTLAMPANVTETLRRHRAEQIARRLAAPSWADGDLVFTTRIGTMIDPANGRRDLTRICDKADVPRLKPNELRHTAASVLSDAGVPMERIADQLGHTTTRMLEATYRHRLRPAVDAAVAVMDGLLARPDAAPGGEQ